MIPFILGIIFGFIFFIISAVASKKIILVKIKKDSCFHVHHYIILIPIFVILGLYMLITKKKHPFLFFILGFCLGGSSTNFLYPDWNKFLTNCDYSEKCVVPLRNTFVGNMLKKLC